jgi:hypothetical protein
MLESGSAEYVTIKKLNSVNENEGWWPLKNGSFFCDFVLKMHKMAFFDHFY